MYVNDIQKIATMMKMGDPAWKIAARIERAYKEGESDVVNLYEDAHYVAVSVMQEQGYLVTQEMSYDDINEVSSAAERAYCYWSDRYVELVEAAYLPDTVVYYA